MKNILLLFSIFLVLSCSSDDNNSNPDTTVPPALSITVTVGAITDHTAVLNWVVEGNTSPVTFEIVIDGQEVADGIDGNQYILTDLDETTTYEGKVFAKEQNNNQTFDNYTLTTSLDLSFEGDFQISSQEEVDSFYYTSISGCLYITGTDITNLLNLSSLQSIKCLSIHNTNLSSLEGLNSLQNLTGTNGVLSIFENDLLLDVSALSNIGSQIKTLRIIDNTTLVNLIGLGIAEEAIELQIKNSAVNDLSMFNNMLQIERLWLLDLPNIVSITGFNNLESFSPGSSTPLQLENLPNLTVLNGFNALTSTFSLSFENLPSLESLEGFNSIINIYDVLSIMGNNNLQSINGFQSLESVDLFLFIKNCENLQNIDGFTNLTSITHSLLLENLPSLTSINAFSQLNSVRNLQIINCENLLSLEGLNNLTNLNGELSLNGLDNLLDLSGLNNVQTLHSLALDGLHSLTNLEGLNNLTEVESGFRISNMNNLNSLSGLENLTSVASYYYNEFDHGWITFINLPQLTNFEGLSSLTFIGQLMIRDCQSLTSLDGFNNVYQTFYGGAFYTIFDNSNLTDFCGLSLYANSNEQHPSSYNYTSGNAYNPTWVQIQSPTECSQ